MNGTALLPFAYQLARPDKRVYQCFGHRPPNHIFSVTVNGIGGLSQALF